MSPGIETIVTLWLVALGGLLLGVIVGPLLTNTPSIAIRSATPAPVRVVDDFFGTPRTGSARHHAQPLGRPPCDELAPTTNGAA